MHSLRQLLGRSTLTVQETKMLHGLARQMLWTANQVRPKEDGQGT